jgi:hypothetical protein
MQNAKSDDTTTPARTPIRDISKRMTAQLRQIRDAQRSVVIKREAVEPLLKRGLIDELDGPLFLTEAGGAVLEAARIGG